MNLFSNENKLGSQLTNTVTGLFLHLGWLLLHPPRVTVLDVPPVSHQCLHLGPVPAGVCGLVSLSPCPGSIALNLPTAATSFESSCPWNCLFMQVCWKLAEIMDNIALVTSYQATIIEGASDAFRRLFTPRAVLKSGPRVGSLSSFHANSLF